MDTNRTWMRTLAFLVPGTGLMCLASQVAAQTVQLPTFQRFRVNTTVSVPDGGSVSLGGVYRSRSGSATNSLPFFGGIPVANRLFQNRAIGRQDRFSRAYVSAKIIDLREMDEAVLRQAKKSRGQFAGQPLLDGPRPTQAELRARYLTENVGRTSRNPHVQSFAAQATGSEPAVATAANSSLQSSAPSLRTARQVEPPLMMSRKSR